MSSVYARDPLCLLHQENDDVSVECTICKLLINARFNTRRSERKARQNLESEIRKLRRELSQRPTMRKREVDAYRRGVEVGLRQRMEADAERDRASTERLMTQRPRPERARDTGRPQPVSAVQG